MQPSTLVFHGFMCFSTGVSERILNVVSSFEETHTVNFEIVFQHQTFIAHARSIFLLFQVYKFMSIIRVCECSCEQWQPTEKLCKNSHGSQLQLVHTWKVPASELRKFLANGWSLHPPLSYCTLVLQYLWPVFLGSESGTVNSVLYRSGSFHLEAKFFVQKTWFPQYFDLFCIICYFLGLMEINKQKTKSLFLHLEKSLVGSGSVTKRYGSETLLLTNAQYS